MNTEHDLEILDDGIGMDNRYWATYHCRRCGKRRTFRYKMGWLEAFHHVSTYAWLGCVEPPAARRLQVGDKALRQVLAEEKAGAQQKTLW